jgi:hypothetical protein
MHRRQSKGRRKKIESEILLSLAHLWQKETRPLRMLSPTLTPMAIQPSMLPNLQPVLLSSSFKAHLQIL